MSEYQWYVEPVGRWLWSYTSVRGLVQIAHGVRLGRESAIKQAKRYIEKDQRDRERTRRERVTGTWP